MTPGIVHVVDDDELARSGAARLLTAAGLDVRTYASALEFLGTIEPDAAGCIILDVQLPDQSGLELQVALTHVVCEIVRECALDVARVRVVSFAEIAVVAVHLANQVRHFALNRRGQPGRERGAPLAEFEDEVTAL